MASLGIALDLLGTSEETFFVGGAVGVQITNASGSLEVRNMANSAYEDLHAQNLKAAADLVLGYGGTYTTSLASAATASWTLTFPVTAGTTGQVLATDGAGNTYWVTTLSGAAFLQAVSHTINTGDGASFSFLSLPAGGEIDRVEVIVDTVFNDVPTLSIGDAANHSKYMATTQNSLTYNTMAWQTNPSYPPAADTIVGYFSTAASSAGVARAQLWYASPTIV